ncbi:hypothetical protein FACS1894159_05440 [Bacteroidia bacterium]|nr:hypothetical protein FACS1894159_05440 [Bacteroidia bacterium]
MTNLYSLLSFSGCMALSGAMAAAQPRTGPRAQDSAVPLPNFVIIMADDMGYGDIGCFGNKTIRTPALDQMAAEGMLLSDYHSNGAVSTPTRAALLTGRYQQRAGLEGVLLTTSEKHRRSGLQPQEVTFARVLSANGYRTAMFGKWHLGYLAKYNPATVHGFGEFTGFLSGNVDYKAFLDSQGRYDWWHRDSVEQTAGYLTDVINRSGVDFIRRNAGEPFCLYLAHGCPHSPYQGPDDPPVRTRGSAGTGDVPGKSREECYREMIERLDLGIGLVMEALKETGIDRNTLVIFVSDNGPTVPGSAGGLRGAKGDLFEGGHRVPAIVRMPSTIKASSRSAQTILSMDIFPTMLDMAGVRFEAGDRPLDGLSFVPALRGDRMPARTLFWRSGGMKAAREGRWKYVEVETGRGPNKKSEQMLFDLDVDLSEQNNVIGTNRGVAASLRQKLDDWQRSVDSDVPEQTK